MQSAVCLTGIGLGIMQTAACGMRRPVCVVPTPVCLATAAGCVICSEIPVTQTAERMRHTWERMAPDRPVVMRDGLREGERRVFVPQRASLAILTSLLASRQRLGAMRER